MANGPQLRRVRSGQRCRELFKVMFWMPRSIETVHAGRVSHFAMRASANS